MFKDSTIRRPHDINPEEWRKMEEAGRMRAAAVMATNPEQRVLVEQIFGVEYCKARYPEAYPQGVA